MKTHVLLFGGAICGGQRFWCMTTTLYDFSQVNETSIVTHHGMVVMMLASECLQHFILRFLSNNPNQWKKNIHGLNKSLSSSCQSRPTWSWFPVTRSLILYFKKTHNISRKYNLDLDLEAMQVLPTIPTYSIVPLYCNTMQCTYAQPAKLVEYGNHAKMTTIIVQNFPRLFCNSPWTDSKPTRVRIFFKFLLNVK